ncbi:MAG: nitroreductase family protein [Spirochaetes bacterium]|nr:nitroreductase family protein [Spirochaetota bacterium]
MNVKDAIQARRAYRALGPVDITDDIIRELVEAARLMPSCFNNQPWRFVFARSAESLGKVRGCLNKGNEWAHKASLIIAAFARREHDCLIKEREYYLFDLGMAVSALLLRATELGLVAHPIAGFDPERTRQALGIPDDCMLITLIIVGKKVENLEGLTPWQVESEAKRPERLAFENIYSIDAFDEKMNAKAGK